MQRNFTITEIDKIAEDCIPYLEGYNIIAFHGNMGVGKTTFIKSLCRVLGVTNPISSPTYSIINQYETGVGKIIYHMDWYRLKDENEAVDVGVVDTLDSGELCFIEWPEKAENLLSEDVLHITIKIINDHTRSLTLHKK